MKKLIIFFIGLLLLSCSSKTEKFLDWEKQDNPKIEDLISILNQPTQTIDYEQFNKKEIRSYTDSYSPDFKTEDELTKYYASYYDKYDRIKKKYEKYGTINSNNPKWYDFKKEYEDWINSKKLFTYEESNYDRIERLKIFYPNWENNENYRNLLDRNDIRFYPNDRIKYIFEKPSTETEGGIDVYEVVMIKSTREVYNAEVMVKTFYKSYDFCECLTFVGDELPDDCKEKFRGVYGTSNPSTSQMRNDYEICKQQGY